MRREKLSISENDYPIYNVLAVAPRLRRINSDYVKYVGTLREYIIIDQRSLNSSVKSFIVEYSRRYNLYHLMFKSGN